MRTVTEIRDSILTKKGEYSELNTLNSSSATAIWRLLVDVVAYAIWLSEALYEQFATDVSAMLDAQIVPVLRWYVVESKKYQYGDDLIWNGEKYVYAEVNPVLCIVTQAAAIEVNGRIQLKVAKGEAGSIEKLSNDELTSFRAFWGKYKPAGVQLSIVSLDADLLQLEANVYYNPLILASDGSLLSDPAEFPVVDAIEQYIEQLPFNSVFKLNALIDAIQAVTGVDDVLITTCEGKAAGGSYAAITREYQSVAGYMNIDPTYPLNTGLTFVANV